MRPFKSPDRKQLTLMPPSIEEWLPDNHLARFVVDVVDQLELKNLYRKYSHTGSTPYDPGMLLSLLFYGYATGVYSSRKIEAATWDSVAFRYISGDLHPDHDTICTFRKRFLKQIQGFFVEILVYGKELGLLKMGKVSIDGTKVQANASKHSAMSYGYMKKLEEQLKTEVAKLLELAEQADAEEARELDIPEELKRRETRIKKIKEAKEVLKQRAKEGHEREMAEYEKKMKERGEKEKASGKKISGKEPQPPKDDGPREKDQYNFSDPESRIMKTSEGFDQCYNAQAAVNEDMLIVGAYANAHPNDKNELMPALASIPEEMGKPESVLADNGYCSEENIKKCIETGVEPFIAAGRQTHNQPLNDLLNETQQPKPDPEASHLEQMRQKLRTAQGKSVYRLRKMTVEPVFGIIKEIMGFRRFLLRGEAQTNGEWLLVCSAYNLKRMFNIIQTAKAKVQ